MGFLQTHGLIETKEGQVNCQALGLGHDKPKAKLKDDPVVEILGGLVGEGAREM